MNASIYDHFMSVTRKLCWGCCINGINETQPTRQIRAAHIYVCTVNTSIDRKAIIFTPKYICRTYVPYVRLLRGPEEAVHVICIWTHALHMHSWQLHEFKSQNRPISYISDLAPSRHACSMSTTLPRSYRTGCIGYGIHPVPNKRLLVK
jgi:hypothetical protein